MSEFKLHIYQAQVDELIMPLDDDCILDGQFEERTDYFSELTLDLNTEAECAKHFVNNNRVLMKLPNEEYREFVLYEPLTDRNSKTVRMSASYLELDKAKIIRPFELNAQTTMLMITDFLSDTEWLVGNVEFAGIQPYSQTKYLGVYSAIREMADFFNVKIKFRIELVNGKVFRYVDIARDFGEFNGVELTDDNGLLNVSIKENTDVVTNLLCIAKDTNDTTFEVVVENPIARNQYGRYGAPLWGIFEVSDSGLTKYQVQSLGEKELATRSQKTVEASSEQVDLYALTGNEYERLDLWDYVRIVSEDIKPTIRLQARVVGIVHNIVEPSDRRLTIGEYIEYQ